MPERCPICKKDRKLISHHLSYFPEIVVKVCWNCHFIAHRLAEIAEEEQDIIISWIKQYGHLWENGHEKRAKTESRKNYHKSEEQINHRKEYHFKKLNTNEMFKRIEKMEKQLKIMDKILCYQKQ